MIPADKQGVFVLRRQIFDLAHTEIVVDGLPATFGKVHHTFFIAFAQNADMIFIDVRGVERNQFGDPKAAGHEQHQDTVISQHKGAFTGGKKPFTFRFLKVSGQRRLALGHVKFLTNIEIQQMAFYGQIIEKGFDRGGPAAAAGGGQRLRSSHILR